MIQDQEESAASAGGLESEPIIDGAGSKSIILFSDGTGNSSAKLFKTNVWRMYEATHLGPPQLDGDPLQIAYYDNGVGTSNFRPVAMLTGIFGVGLKPSVLRIYSFLCRNYKPGDRIYAFGFSRGAFTIRLLVGLIASQGVIRYQNEAALSYQVRDAYRAFCAAHWPNRWLARKVAGVIRWVRDGLITVKRRLMSQCVYSETARHQPDVDFVGVWDTVAAYGGPIAEITRGIDDWIWPLTMPNYGLSSKVKKARHALSLDDERDAFQPLLWDEVREQRMIEAGEVEPGRLRQVWFTGMHADVGGGYPDESLSYVSLLWMMDEVGSDIVLIPELVKRARDMANIYGPIHNSREGFGAYYRYQPRKIDALLDPPSHSTLSLRDPEISRGMASHGLLTSVNIHESAIARIISGTDGYAPLALPAHFNVVAATGPAAQASLTAAQLDAIAAIPSERRTLRHTLQENAWDLVWRRRAIYFATVLASVLTVAIPLYSWLDWIEAYCGDDRCFASKPVQWLGYLLPETANKLVAHYAEKPVLTIIGIVIIVLFMAAGARRERQVRDRMRGIWHSYFNGLPLSGNPPSTRLRRVRESIGYQWGVFALKWKILPALFGWILLVLLTYSFFLLATQTWLAAVEPRNAFCKSRTDREGTSVSTRPIQFRASSPCTDLRINVVEKQSYEITLRQTSHEWRDAAYRATPEAGVVERVPWYMRTMVLYRRVTAANWLKPLIEIRNHEAKGGVWKKIAKFVLGPDIRIRTIDFKPQRDGSYKARFEAEQSGHLYLMLNDAALVFRPSAFYSNNVGEAEISVTPSPAAPAP